ncbi:MAG: glycosyltransferase [Pseudoflavonifractor capillosus]|uniref:glycosyltransferase family 2 protein n=1 Tax=Pseudoflavonifractor capillosus TaxID=106588 RepID=UPI0023F84A02|nr:glycosyltransferase [Pseudoflavonifractor capillosus]MCI5927315.1 glycosyltransferase [Pseudoflavonifractor capillosus]MDY4660488.1 glycosyltransferase [Pseudoflavonifractor capillosus]
MDEKLVSVIVPVYNVELYLDKCIQSICSQTYHFLEIILVDDGSTDNSGKLCDQWVRQDYRVKVIHKKNGGLSDARNAGIEAASGKYYMFVDSDDIITSDTIERLYTAMISQSCEIAVCNMVRLYENGSTEPFYHPADKLTVLAGRQRFETLQQPSVCNKLFTAELFRDIRFPYGKYYEDTFVYHVLAHRASRIVLTGHDGYLYLSRSESILGHPKYSDRYFDFVEAIYTRMIYLVDYNVPYYGEEAGLSLYAATANSEKYIEKTPQNEVKFHQMHNWYQTAYRLLMHSSQVGIKQKIRIFLLRYFPYIHSKLF